MKQLTRSRARGMSQGELKIRAGDGAHPDSAKVADDEMRRRFRAAQEKDRERRRDRVGRQVEHLDDAEQLADHIVSQLPDDYLGGRKVLEAAGLEPVDGFDDQSLGTKALGAIDLRPSWRQQLGICLVLLADATEEGKRAAREELERMAKAAELAVKHESAICDAEKLSDRLVTLNRVYSAVGPAQVLLETAAKSFSSGSRCDHSPEAIAGVLSEGLGRLESYALGEEPDDVDRPDDPPDSIETVGAR